MGLFTGRDRQAVTVASFRICVVAVSAASRDSVACCSLPTFRVPFCVATVSRCSFDCSIRCPKLRSCFPTDWIFPPREVESYSSSSLTDACFGLLGLWKKPAPPAAAAPATIPSPSRAELDQRDSTEKSPALANFLSEPPLNWHRRPPEKVWNGLNLDKFWNGLFKLHFRSQWMEMGGGFQNSS